ncbi:hypothetical protein ES703_02610 [subsurface metagenome]
MDVNEMVFFDALRNIKKRLAEAYSYVILPSVPSKTIEDYTRAATRHWNYLEAVREAEKDLETLLALVTEDPREIALQCVHALKKDELYKTLDITKPMEGSPIGVVHLGQPVYRLAKKPEEDEEQ